MLSVSKTNTKPTLISRRCYAVGVTGIFTVQWAHRGRLNTVTWTVRAGAKRVGFVVGKAEAFALAERCDRLIARWRTVAK
jgi:hypothetical protein